MENTLWVLLHNAKKRVQGGDFHLFTTEILLCVCVCARECACVCVCEGVFVGDKKGDMSPWALHLQSEKLSGLADTEPIPNLTLDNSVFSTV